MAAPTRASTGKRVRRDPEASRDLILAAAERLFAQEGPDRVGLKEVARAAGVSHGLVSHYFGTYGALVELALERRLVGMRMQVLTLLAEGPPTDRPGAIISRLSAAASDPITLRLFAWALLTGRLRSAEFFPARLQGLRLVSDAVEKSLPPDHPGPTRSDVEFVVMTTVAMTFGWAMGKAAMLAGLGRSESAAADDDFRARMTEMIRLYLERSGEGDSPPR